MSDLDASGQDSGAEAPLTDDEAKLGLELIREQMQSGAGPFALVAKLNEGVIEACGLDARTISLVRLAAAAAIGAAPVSWRAHLELAEAIEIDADEILGTLIAIAPLIGSARFLQACEEIIDIND